MKKLIYGLIILLIILHQDVWWWDDSETLVFGFIPIGLAYQAGVSLAAAFLWALAVKYCWPAETDAVEEEAATAGPASGEGGRA